MTAKVCLTLADLQRTQLVYAPDPETPETPLNPSALLSGVAVVRGPSARSLVISLKPLAGEQVSARDELYARTQLATEALDPEESVLAAVEQTLANLPKTGREKVAFERTPLDDNLCRLRAHFADLQRSAVVQAAAPGPNGYDKYKEIVARAADDLAKESRQYVTETCGASPSMQGGLSAAEFGAVQHFNHLQRVMRTMFELPSQDSEVYLEPALDAHVSLDDTEHGGMNRVFAGISYSGSSRPFYMRYMPFYVMSMRSPLFIQALSRASQLAATTTRPGPHRVPYQLAQHYGVPRGVQLTYHSVGRYGLSNQRDTAAGDVPMRFYYSFQDHGITRVLALNKKEHFYIQLVNRPPLQLPAGLVGNPNDVEAQYVMYNRAKNAYEFQAGRDRLLLTQQQYQNVLQHNATPERLADPNSPVHDTSDGSLDAVMNKIFNENAVRVVSNRSAFVQLIPEGFKDKLQLMSELTEIIRPDFEREQSRIQVLRKHLFEEFANHKISKEDLEDRCRKAAVAAFRRLVAERRLQVPPEKGKALIAQAAAVFNDRLDDLFADKANDFAKTAAARYFFVTKQEPVFSVVKAQLEKNAGFLNVARIREELNEDSRRHFDATVLRISEVMKEPGSFRDQLKAVYWGGVTQHLMDQYYGPEGIIRGGDYIGREGLPRKGREFMAYLERKAPELFTDPVQVANRLGATFAYYEYNVSPYHSIPWPNLYRNNDRMREREKKANTVREPRTYKPEEPPVVLSINLDDKAVRMTGTRLRESRPSPSDRRSTAPASAVAQATSNLICQPSASSLPVAIGLE